MLYLPYNSFVYAAINWLRFLISTQRGFQEMQLKTKYATQRKTSQIPKGPLIRWFRSDENQHFTFGLLRFLCRFSLSPCLGVEKRIKQQPSASEWALIIYQKYIYTLYTLYTNEKHLINHCLPKYTVSLHTLEN